MPIQENNAMHLSGRTLIRIGGADAAAFLQNVMTNDIAAASGGNIAYSCLLTPQGQFLHDFFVVPAEEGYLVDVESAQADDLLRRFTVFRLRAKVVMEKLDDTWRVYAGGAGGFADPRHPSLPARRYARDEPPSTAGDGEYEDLCIALGVPTGIKTVRPERDTLSDVNLDHLNAVAWDKGCYIGQEVTARMRYRGLAKKRLMIVTGQGLTAGEKLSLGEAAAGEIRQADSRGENGLAVVKLAALAPDAAPLTGADGRILAVKKPAYLQIPQD